MLMLVLTVLSVAPLDPPYSEYANAMRKQLDDPKPEVRRAAIRELRMLSGRVDRTGGARVQHGEPVEPKFEGLVPDLARAADDEDENNRILALFALADTTEPAAAEALRKKLKDKNAKVRLTAACLLTEFKDASGLDEMKTAMKRFRDDLHAGGAFSVEMLLASFERITGKGFGPLPPNPFLASNGEIARASEKRYREMLDAWAAWWAWEPGK